MLILETDTEARDLPLGGNPISGAPRIVVIEQSGNAGEWIPCAEGTHAGGGGLHLTRRRNASSFCVRGAAPALPWSGSQHFNEVKFGFHNWCSIGQVLGQYLWKTIVLHVAETALPLGSWPEDIDVDRIHV